MQEMQEMWETWVQSLGWEDPLEKEMATHSSVLVWRIPWTGELRWLRSMGVPKVQHISSTKPPPPPNHWTARRFLFLQIKFYCDTTTHLFTYCLRQHACYRCRIVFGTKITLNHKSKTIDYLALYRKETKLPAPVLGPPCGFWPLGNTR